MLITKLKQVLKYALSRTYNHDVFIEHKELISSTAVVQVSQLLGNVIVGENCKIIRAKISGDVKIGKWTVLAGPGIDIYSEINPIEIGNFCSIAHTVSMHEVNHNIKRITSFYIMKNIFKENLKYDLTSNGGIFIGNDVWIGAQSVILSGAYVSDGCVVGANSVVTGYLPPYCIALGSPAKVVRYRFDGQLIDKLLELQWWLWADDKIQRNKNLFIGDLTNEHFEAIVD